MAGPWVTILSMIIPVQIGYCPDWNQYRPIWSAQAEPVLPKPGYSYVPSSVHWYVAWEYQDEGFHSR